MEATDIDSVQLVHIHGWAGRPEDGYVFSLPEYASTMIPSNAWTSILAHTIATEPFIIAGTSLEEPDLEYFLAGRRSEGVRRDRGPSFLVDPYPDAVTERDCERHGLHLYKGTLLDFINELDESFPSRPLPANATSKLSKELFSRPPSSRDLTLFSRDFGYVVAREGHEDADLSFFVGRKPTSNDIALGRDIARTSTLQLKADIKKRLAATPLGVNFLIADDNAGAGKTTIVTRVAFDLAGEGFHIFEYKNHSTPNLDLCAAVLNTFIQPFILVCDDFADHVPAFFELHGRLHRSDYLIVGCERSYRINHVMQTLAGAAFDRFTLEPFNVKEARDLIVAMEKHGLTSTREFSRHAADIARDPIAIAVCRVMKDFLPVERIIRSLIADSDDGRIRRYVACALAAYCYRVGLAHSILSIAFDNTDLRRQFLERDRLPLSFSDPGRTEYVIPTNPTLGLRVLREIAKSDSDTMFEVYCAVGAYLAPYVNRQTIRRRTPEARLAGRLFDYDDVVSEFIADQSEAFYLAMKRHWECNSRYWEQFALLKLDKFLRANDETRFDLLAQAISHARHAVQIERHQFCLTTLGRILFEQMQHSPDARIRSFREAFQYLEQAIKMEGMSNRVAVHPYMTLFGGVSRYIDMSGTLSPKELDSIRGHLASVHPETVSFWNRRPNSGFWGRKARRFRVGCGCIPRQSETTLTAGADNASGTHHPGHYI
jgi:SIR2-like domain